MLCVGHLHVTDFGLAKRLKIGQRTSTICGTLQYIGLLRLFMQTVISFLLRVTTPWPPKLPADDVDYDDDDDFDDNGYDDDSDNGII